MDQTTKNSIAAALGIGADEQVILDTGGDHRYGCACEICRQWWQSVGPEDPEHPYGPFTIEQIEDGSPAGNACKETRLAMIKELEG